MNNKDKQNGRYVWIPISAWYGDGQGNIFGIDIDDADVDAMCELISKKRDDSYWAAVLSAAMIHIAGVRNENQTIDS